MGDLFRTAPGRFVGRYALMGLAVAAALVFAPRLPAPWRPLVMLLTIAAVARVGGRDLGLVAALLMLAPIALAHAQPRSAAVGSPPRAASVAFLTASLVLSVVAGSRAETAAMLRRARSGTGLLLTLAREGVWIVDRQGRTTYASPRLAEMLGCKPTELRGCPIHERLARRGGDEEKYLETLLAPEADAPGPRRSLRFRRFDGLRVQLALAAAPLPAEFDSPGVLLVVEDVTERAELEHDYRRMHQDLRSFEKRYGRLVGSNILGIITASLDGLILEANDAFLDLVGGRREDLEQDRLRWTELTPPELQPRDEHAIDELWVGGACTPYEKEFLRPDGTRVPVLFGAASLGRYPRRWIGFVLDLTERRRAERALLEAKEAAEAAGQAKDRFLAMLSHELRTPLTPALLTVDALLDDPDTPLSLHEPLETIRRGIRLEARLVDDLLDATRVQAGKLRLACQVVDAHAVLRQALATCGEDLDAAGVRLDLDLDGNGCTLDADPARLQQIIWNLVKNACKFTPAGGTITVRTRIAESALSIAVADTGRGLEAALLERIFEPFEQGAAGVQRPGGLGLGLAIARALAEAHGGRLTAASAGPGRGTTFTLELPRPVDARPRNALRRDPPESWNAGRPRRLLLVEDDPASSSALSLLLRRRGATVTTASCLAEARAAAESGTFDLVVSDLGLPDGSGLELARWLAARGGPPAIALSGYGMEEDIQQCHDAGFLTHLTKPVELRRLEEVIGRATATSRRR